MALNARQTAFVRHYRETGNASESARRAGYSGTPSSLRTQASRLLANANISAELARFEARQERQSIATVDELFEFWTDVVRSERADLKDRLKASELRAKAAGAFIERHQHSGANGGAIEIRLSVEAAYSAARDGSLPALPEGEDDDET